MVSFSGGKCGICGEPYDRAEKLFEKGGRMYTGKIVQSYKQGQEIEVKVKVREISSTPQRDQDFPSSTLALSQPSRLFRISSVQCGFDSWFGCYWRMPRSSVVDHRHEQFHEVSRCSSVRLGDDHNSCSTAETNLLSTLRFPVEIHHGKQLGQRSNHEQVRPWSGQGEWDLHGLCRYHYSQQSTPTTRDCSEEAQHSNDSEEFNVVVIDSTVANLGHSSGNDSQNHRCSS